MCTEKVRCKGLGLGTDEFCSITKLDINAVALQARFFLFVSSPAPNSFPQLTFLCLVPLKPLHLPLSNNKYLFHPRREKPLKFNPIHINEYICSLCYLQGTVQGAADLMAKETEALISQD